ncbi:MAG: DUF2911 domain-containing protein [Parafilimonas sp.]
MKKFLLIAVFSTAIFISNAQVQMPAPSSTQTLIQDFGMGKIELTYSRPSLKNRKVFEANGELVPLGEMWRTGANAATRVKFTDKVNIGGKDFDTGTYVLYTIPGEKDWTIIINKGINNWGTDGYKESEDVVRFTAPSYQVHAQPVETFTMEFGDIKPESCNLYLIWSNTAVVIPVTTKIQDRLRTQIEQALQSADKKPYWQAANFYYEWDKNYSKALENANAALKERPDGFFIYMLKAKIEKAMNNNSAAKASAEKCKELAMKQNNDDYVKQADKFLAEM